MNIVVFASGSGTTLQSIIDSIESRYLEANIVLVVSNKSDAYALERAKLAGIGTYIIQAKETEAIDIELSQVLSNHKVDLIVLAGYLKMIGNRLINEYTIINTHPSLLPKFGGEKMYGMNVHKAVIDAKEEYSGVTLHYVNNEYDKGIIIKQTRVKVDCCDTPESLSAKVQEAEKIQLVEELRVFSNNINSSKIKG